MVTLSFQQNSPPSYQDGQDQTNLYRIQEFWRLLTVLASNKPSYQIAHLFHPL